MGLVRLMVGYTVNKDMTGGMKAEIVKIMAQINV
jgi:hypothetical protein